MIFESGTLDHHRYIKEMLPVALKYGNDMFENDWTFQRDGAKAHIDEKSQEWCAKNFLSFIGKDHWPPNSPDLNSFDYCVCNEIAQVKHNDIEKDRRCAVKKVLSLQVACLGPIECPKTKEIILNNKIEHFCRELKGEFSKKKIRSKDQKSTAIVNPSFILGHPLSYLTMSFLHIITNHKY